MSVAVKPQRRKPVPLPQDVPGTDVEVVAILGAEGLPGAPPVPRNSAPPRDRGVAVKDRYRYLVAQVLHPTFVSYYDAATHSYRTNAPRQATVFRRPSIARAVQEALGPDEHTVLKCTVDAQGRLQPRSIEFKGWRRARNSTPEVEYWEQTKRAAR